MYSALRLGIACIVLGLAASTALADEQVVAPGTAPQNAVVVNTGPDGICNTTAATGDIQAAVVGQGTPFRTVSKCGVDKTVSTTAAGDDTQLVAVGGTCKNANIAIVDSGPNGIAETTAAGDDTQEIAVGTAPSNTPCVITGGNGVADTGAASGDDNLVLTPVGAAEPNSPVILCGPNGVADTTANNVNLGGDDVQVVAVGAACSPNDVVVDSGANGIADTQAEGPDLVLKAGRPLRLVIGSGQPSASRTVKLLVSNVEFGASAPASRTYLLKVTKGSCPGGTVNQVDADSSIPGLQATASIPKGGKVKASFVVTLHLQDVTTVGSNAPFRCNVNVDAIASDTNPDVDDAANSENNSTAISVDVTDENDR
jgi:hypothetical protein